MIKITPLTETHIALGAKMTEFAGYNMPVYYDTISEEHHAVRNAVGVFDVSHMGEFIVKGKEATQLVDRISSNNAARLEIGQAQYSCIPNESGGIVDDFLVYRLPEDMCGEGETAFMLVVNASNIEKDWDWINKFNHYDTRIIDISDRTGLLAVQGPLASELLQELCEDDLSQIEYYHFIKTKLAGIPNVLVSATGYTGSGGFELYVESNQLKNLWDAIFTVKHITPKPVGLGARDTLRLEMGYCLYGNDIDDQSSPIEAGLGWITKTKKASDFSSKEIFLNQRQEGVSKKLVGFRLSDRRVPRKSYQIYNGEEQLIGEVTSGTMSPSLNCPIGLGYVAINNAKNGEQIFIKIGKKLYPAVIEKLPFYKAS